MIFNDCDNITFELINHFLNLNSKIKSEKSSINTGHHFMDRVGRGSIKSIEFERERIIEFLNLTTSEKSKLINLSEYLNSLLNIPELTIREAYINELFEDYIQLLHIYNPLYLSSEVTLKILSVAKLLSESAVCVKNKAQLDDAIVKLQIKTKELENILSNNVLTIPRNNIYFPVLEHSEIDESNSSGFLETISIQIRKSDHKNTFRLIPGEIKRDNLIEEQLVVSWNLALKKVKPFIKKIENHHEVFIHFDNALGYYRGNSLGTALTLLFIERLLKFYNSPTLITTKGRITFTGGLDDTGCVLNTSSKIIKQKVEIVFYSDVQIFCIPKEEEVIALQTLNQLKQKYPKRDLKIIGVESLDDILDRRTIITIKKLNPIKRTMRFVLRNLVSTILILLLLFSVYAAGLWDFDENPAYCVQKGKTIIVKNKNGKLLWTKNTRTEDDPTFPLIKVIQKVIDIDSDNTNEVLISFGLESLNHESAIVDSITCFDSEGDILWQYLFEDTIETVEGKFTNPYGVFILGEYSKQGRKIILLSARNHFYPTAIFQLDAITGKRIGTTLWHPGHVNSGLIGDFNNDGFEELIAAGINNCYESATVFSINLNKLDGYAPAEGEYRFVNKKLAEFNKYHLIEKTDFTIYHSYRFNSLFPGGLAFNENSGKILLTILEGPYSNPLGVSYMFNSDLTLATIDPSDEIQVHRDTLVSRRLISGPYTKSQLYRKSLWQKIKSWNGIEFVQMNKLY